MKAENIVVQVELIASSTLTPIAKTAMRKHIKEITLVCSIYDVHHRKLAEKHELEVGENRIEKVKLVLADPPYNLQRF